MRSTDAFGVSRGYEQYFGLVESPFSLTPNTRFLFESESHTAALEQITVALRRREALTVITGEVGTGKTMLCRAFVQDVEPRTFVSVIANPLLSADDLLKQLLLDFGLMTRDETRSSGLTQHEMVAALQRFLSTLVPLRAHAIVLIDEAQHLQTEVLEQLRLLTNFETGDQKLLQVVLLGQLDLDHLIDRPDMKQLRQRISRRHQLAPLRPHEVEQYIERRLWVAHGGLGLARSDRPFELAPGERFWRVRFSPSAMRAIARLSRGLPRSINVICDRALERAHQSQQKLIDLRCVVATALDLKMTVATVDRVRATRWPALAAAAGLLLVLGTVAWRAWPGVPGGEPSHIAGVSAGVPASGLSSPGAAPSPDAPEVAAALPEATGFRVAVAAFKTESRADEVVRSLRLLDLPAYVQPDPSGTHVVSVGPFASREEAQEAQSHVARVHLTDSRIVALGEADGAAGIKAVATTGQQGHP